MHSIVLLDETDAAIQAMLWTILAVFFMTVILGWLVAGRDWLAEEESVTAKDREENNEVDKASQQ